MEKLELKNTLNSLYINQEAPWGREADPLVEKAAEHFTGNEVLDLGAGDGRNALFLAERGFNVTAVDLSEKALGQLNSRIAGANLTITSLNEDITTYDFPDSIDNVICSLVLHFLKRDEAQNVLYKIVESTPKEGVAVFKHFTNIGDLSMEEAGYWPKAGETRDYFKGQGFLVLHAQTSRQETLYQQNPTSKTMHEAEELILRKIV